MIGLILFAILNFYIILQKKAMAAKENYQKIINSIPENIELVAVSKTYGIEAIREIYDLGQRVFGENKVQEILQKQAFLPSDIKWHLIGHLQTNKVKYIAGFIDTIESVDSEKLLREIDKQAEKYNRIIKILLQVKIAKEDSKTGMNILETRELFYKFLQEGFKNVEITGLMGIASLTNSSQRIREEFLILKNLFDELSKERELSTLSMGMSGDYPLAIECGSTSVRIGSLIFGSRNYH